MHREDFSYFSIKQGIKPTVGLLPGSSTGADIDTRGYDSLTFNVHLVAASTAVDPTTSYWYARIEHTDASALGLGPSDYAVCASIDLIRQGTSAAVTSGIVPINASTYSAACMKIGYRGGKRYVRCNISTTGAMASSASGVIFVEAQLGHVGEWPVTTPNLD